MAGRVDRRDVEPVTHDRLPGAREQARRPLVQATSVAHEQKRSAGSRGRRRPEDARNLPDGEAAVDHAVQRYLRDNVQMHGGALRECLREALPATPTAVARS